MTQRIPEPATSDRRFVLSIVVEKDGDGYFAFCPSLQGCYTQRDSYEEVLDNIQDAIRLHVEDRLASGEPVPMKSLNGC